MMISALRRAGSDPLRHLRDFILLWSCAAALLLGSCGGGSAATRTSAPATATATAAAAPTAAPSATPDAVGAPVVDGQRVYEHVRKLAVEIGPRVAGTAGEVEARDYIRDTLSSYGYDVSVQDFAFDASAYLPARVDFAPAPGRGERHVGAGDRAARIGCGIGERFADSGRDRTSGGVPCRRAGGWRGADRARRPDVLAEGGERDRSGRVGRGDLQQRGGARRLRPRRRRGDPSGEHRPVRGTGSRGEDRGATVRCDGDGFAAVRHGVQRRGEAEGRGILRDGDGRPLRQRAR